MLFIIIIIIGGGIEFEPKCWSHRKCGESETTEHGPRNKTKKKKKKNWSDFHLITTTLDWIDHEPPQIVKKW